MATRHSDALPADEVLRRTSRVSIDQLRRDIETKIANLGQLGFSITRSFFTADAGYLAPAHQSAVESILAEYHAAGWKLVAEWSSTNPNEVTIRTV